MNSNNLFQLVQQSFRVTVGATASFVETLQNPQKREAALSELQQELSQRTQEWAEKGENTEQEARKVLDNLFNQQSHSHPSSPGESNHSSSSSSVSTPSDEQTEIQELTQQIVALRTELEQLRNSEQ